MYRIILVVFLLPPLTQANMQNNLYQINNFNINPGLYFDKISDVKLYNDQWRVITFIDLNQLIEEYKLITHYGEKLKYNCDRVLSFGRFVCDNQHFLQSTARRLQETEKKWTVLNDLVGNARSTRRKRGVLNFMGSIFKILFGTLDETDAQYFSEQIDEVYANNKKLASLLKDQTNIVESFLHNVNITFNQINDEFVHIDKRITNLENLVDDIVRRIRIHTLQMDMNAHVIELESLTKSYESRLDTLINAIMMASTGMIHPEILSPAQFTNILLDVKTVIESPLDFPAPLNPKNALDIISVSTVHIFFFNNRLICSILIPLLERDTFEAFHLIPIPKHLDKDVYVYLHPSKNIIISSLNRQKFLLVDDLSAHVCKPLKDSIICFQQEPLYSAYAHGTCETDLLTSGTSDIERYCDVRLFRTQTSTWKKLSKKNSWLFVTSKTEVLDIVCNHQNSDHVLVNGSGLITLGKHCKAWSKSVELITQNIESSNYTTNLTVFQSQINWTTLWQELQAPNHTEKILELVPREYNKPNIHLEDLKSVSIKLADVRKHADDIIHQQRQKVLLNAHHSYIWYIFYALCMIFALFLFCNGRCCVIYKLLLKWLCISGTNVGIHPTSRIEKGSCPRIECPTYQGCSVEMNLPHELHKTLPTERSVNLGAISSVQNDKHSIPADKNDGQRTYTTEGTYTKDEQDGNDFALLRYLKRNR